MKNLPTARTDKSKAIQNDAEKILTTLPMMSENEKERFVRSAIAICNTPQIDKCDRGSVLRGVWQCAIVGLNLDPVLGHANLIPYKTKDGMKAQLIIGYKGFIELARRSGAVSHIDAEVVYENDDFDVTYGTERRIHHRPYYMGGHAKPGERRFSYAVATLKNGQKQFTVCTAEQIELAKSSSKSKDSKYSPWNTAIDSMWKKTAVRQLSKWIPQTQPVSQATDWEEKDERDEPIIIEQIASDEPQEAIQDPLLDGDFEVVEDDGISEEEAEAIRQAEIEEANADF